MISINYEIIKQNIKSINKNKILVLKDNAYGFGLSKMLDVALSCGECMFAVKDIKEADVIIKKIPNAMVLILGPILSCDNRYVYTVSNDDDYQFCIKNDLNFHIKLNLGMNRFGFNNLPSYINDNNCLGLYFHCPDKSKKDNIKKLKKFEKITQSIKRQDLIYHVGGSCFIEIEHNFYVRFGISMYKNSFKLSGKILRIRTIDKGQTVGYTNTYKAKKDILIGICDIGYVNGISRYNSKDNYVLINYRKYKLIGVKCMDYSFILIDEFVKENDEVVFIGSNIDDYKKQNKVTDYEIYLNTK